ncbi:LPS export ABC transporter periplasmic protein LptC [Marinomonas primoryensis]|uniref:LPS export ABC transporter periplasmic protein LptC n=1 Tax=Marinomonas primoryensis TaxID=178399 RepID=A0A859CVG8_9GAMM|nr:LPS export ABC transporter periplasmic protein LptC [Marinomonas primoryensis]QKK80474.1 LPS export ABC transporter periplasmic protein LptC [Marinomonas primoryensis]
MQMLKKMVRFNSLLFIGAALVLVASLFWYGATPKQNLVEANSLSSSPDYFITQVKVKEFDINGMLVETLNAQQTLHYITKSKTLLEFPSVERHSISGSWSAKADKGVIDDGSNDILLTNNARATKKYLQSDDIKLTADSVHYLDKDQSLTSQGNATLISVQGETSASTITTYINSEEVFMTGSVRGKYETIH